MDYREFNSIQIVDSIQFKLLTRFNSNCWLDSIQIVDLIQFKLLTRFNSNCWLDSIQIVDSIQFKLLTRFNSNCWLKFFWIHAFRFIVINMGVLFCLSSVNTRRSLLLSCHVYFVVLQSWCPSRWQCRHVGKGIRLPTKPMCLTVNLYSEACY